MAIPGDQAEKMINQLYGLAEKYSYQLDFDTVFVNEHNKDITIKAKHKNQTLID